MFYYVYGYRFGAMRYELFNKQGFCDPTFYYGSACRDYIARNITQDRDLVKYKKKFYRNIDELIYPLKKLNTAEIDEANNEIDKENVLVSDNYINDSTKKIQNITDVLTQIKTQSLGNLGSGMSKPLKDVNAAISDKLKDLPNTLKRMQTMLNDGFIKPSTIHLHDALEKLYKSTLDSGAKPAISTMGNNAPMPRFSPDIPIGK